MRVRELGRMRMPFWSRPDVLSPGWPVFYRSGSPFGGLGYYSSLLRQRAMMYPNPMVSEEEEGARLGPYYGMYGARIPEGADLDSI